MDGNADVSRRRMMKLMAHDNGKFGLSCPCLPQEMHSKIKSQGIENVGIREESSTREGGDDLSTAASFSPGGFVQFLESLAEVPHSNVDRLRFSITKARLLAFSRWRGQSQLPVFEQGRGLLEDETRFTVVAEDMDYGRLMKERIAGPEGSNEVPSRKRQSIARGGPSQKRKCLPNDAGQPDMEEKYALDSPNDENKAVKRTCRKKVSFVEKQAPVSAIPRMSDVKSRKTLLSPESTNDKALKTIAYLGVGKHVRKEPSGRRSSNEVTTKSEGTMGSFSSGKSQREIIPAQMPTPDEILSKLSFAARNPMQSYELINAVVDMLRGFRNSACEEKLDGPCQEDHSRKNNGKQISNTGTSHLFGFEGMEDSYWTDGIIQSDSQDRAWFESENPNNRLETGIGLVEINLDKSKDVVIVDKEKERLAAATNEISDEESPTALIFNFSDLESIPSISNLNEIFSRYGPLKESETAILRKSKRAKMIFKRRADAETAFSSTGKYTIFGPSLVSYRLNYAPTPPKIRASTRRNKKTDL